MTAPAPAAPAAPSELDRKPVEPIDYAILNAAYGSLLGTLVLAARRRRHDQVEAIGSPELVPLGLATFALSKLVVHEKVEAWVRGPFVAQEEDGAKRPRGHRLRYAMGELMTCTRCVGGWGALGLVALRVASPPAGRVVTAVLSASAANDFLQTAFSWACEKANEAG